MPIWPTNPRYACTAALRRIPSQNRSWLGWGLGVQQFRAAVLTCVPNWKSASSRPPCEIGMLCSPPADLKARTGLLTSRQLIR